MAGMKFELPEDKVLVKFVKRPHGNITDPNHVAYGGLLEDSIVSLPAKQLENGKYANVLSKEEKEGLELLMGLEPNDLSVYKKINNYWDGISIKLSKEDFYLEPNNPEEFIKLRILESYTDKIAKNLTEYNNKKKATYRWVLVRHDEESKNFNKVLDSKKEMYKAVGKIEDNKEAMLDYLRMSGIRVPEDSSLDFLKSEVGKRAENNPKLFLDTLNDKDYKLKLLLSKSVTAKTIILSGGLYQTAEGVNICHSNRQPNLAEALSYLSSGEGQDLRVGLEYSLEKIKG